MNDITRNITEEELDRIIIEDLETHFKYSDDDEIKKACEVLLNFYKESFEGNETQTNYMYGDLNNIPENIRAMDLSKSTELPSYNVSMTFKQI